MSSPQNRPEFDRFARDYDTLLLDCSMQASGFPASYFTERKVIEIRETLRAAGRTGGPLRILNFGCGIGKSEPYLVRSLPGAEIVSLDISSESIAVARENNRGLPGVHFAAFDGRTIAHPAGFDVIMLAGVVHHIRPEERAAVALELNRVLADKGFLFVFEHNPRNPVTRRVVRDCPLDEDAELVTARELAALLRSAGFGDQTFRYIHFFPHLLRILLPLERWMRWIPWGAQYYCIARKQGQRS